MNREAFEQARPNLDALDLQNYGIVNLSDQGYLEVYSHFKHPIYVTLGREALIEIAHVSSVDESTTADQQAGYENAYTVRNVDDQNAEPIILKSHLAADDMVLADAGDTDTTRYIDLRVGRETTPQLRLGRYVSRKHLYIAAFPDSLIFGDADSTNGSVVYLNPADNDAIKPPRRTFQPGMMKLRTEHEGRWLR